MSRSDLGKALPASISCTLVSLNEFGYPEYELTSSYNNRKQDEIKLGNIAVNEPVEIKVKEVADESTLQSDGDAALNNKQEQSVTSKVIIRSKNHMTSSYRICTEKERVIIIYV